MGGGEHFCNLEHLSRDCFCSLGLLRKSFTATKSAIHLCPQVFTYKQSTITNQKVTAMHPLHEEGVDDMASLTELHGGSIMYNLFQRYKRNQIYVSTTCGSLGFNVELRELGQPPPALVSVPRAPTP